MGRARRSAASGRKRVTSCHPPRYAHASMGASMEMTWTRAWNTLHLGLTRAQADGWLAAAGGREATRGDLGGAGRGRRAAPAHLTCAHRQHAASSSKSGRARRQAALPQPAGRKVQVGPHLERSLHQVPAARVQVPFEALQQLVKADPARPVEIKGPEDVREVALGHRQADLAARHLELVVREPAVQVYGLGFQPKAAPCLVDSEAPPGRSARPVCRQTAAAGARGGARRRGWAAGKNTWCFPQDPNYSSFGPPGTARPCAAKQGPCSAASPSRTCRCHRCPCS